MRPLVHTLLTEAQWFAISIEAIEVASVDIIAALCSAGGHAGCSG